MIQKDDVKGKFTKVGNEILNDPKLSVTDLGLYAKLRSLGPEWKFSIDGLTRITADGRDKLTASLRRLEESGYIEILPSKVKGQFHTDLVVHNTPQRNTRNGLAVAEKPQRNTRNGLAVAEKPSQSNINTKDVKEKSEECISIIQSLHGDEGRVKDDWATFQVNINAESLIKEAASHSEDGVVINLLDILKEIITAPKESYSIEKKEIPGSKVRERVLMLSETAIRTFLNNIYARMVDQPIHNMTSYLITCLYNASFSGEIEAEFGYYDEYLVNLRGTPY